MSSGLPMDDDPFIKMLSGLRGHDMTVHESGVVCRIARFTPTPRVLEYIATVPKWYARWEIREALFQNAACPERLRDPLGTSIAAVDLMREMDGKSLHDAEREEIREDIRSLLRSLPAVDRDIVKAHARSLAAAAEEAAEATARDDEAVQLASTARSREFLAEALLDPRRRVRQAALENPELDAELVVERMRTTDDEELIGLVATTPRWAYRDAIRKALQDNPVTPRAIRSSFVQVADLELRFGQFFNQVLEPDEKASAGKGLLAELQALPAADKEYLKYRLGPAWKPFIAEVTASIEQEFKRLQPTPVTTAWPERSKVQDAPRAAPRAQERDVPRKPEPARARKPRGGFTVEPFVPDGAPVRPPGAGMRETFDGARRPAEPPIDRAPVSAEARHHLARTPLEERVMIAQTTRDRSELAFLLHETDDRVFNALLANPALSEEDAVAAARSASRERVEKLFRSPRFYSLSGVKLALLHNPHAPETIQLQCLGDIGSVRELLAVMRDPAIRSIDLKARARARMLDRYQAMTTDQRAATVRQCGGDLLNELWSLAFNDEQTLVRLLSDRSLDEGIVLRIAQSRIAPREVLSSIAREAGLVNNYSIRLALALNPKTPREAVARLVPRLSEPDRKRLKASQQVPEFVRELA